MRRVTIRAGRENGRIASGDSVARLDLESLNGIRNVTSTASSEPDVIWYADDKGQDEAVSSVVRFERAELEL